MKVKLIFYLCVISIVYMMPLVIFASGSMGITVNRTAVVFDINTGESQEFSVKVKNISNKTQTIKIGVMNYILGNNNAITLFNGNEDNGIREFIESRDKSIILKSGEVKEVFFDIEIPKDALIGSHRGVILLHAVLDDKNAINVDGRIGVHVLVNVKGDTYANGYISKFDIPLITTGLINYTTIFKNTGNIHYVPYGEISIYNIFTKNKQLYKYDKHFVFPDREFTFSRIKQIPSVIGLYKVKVTFVDGEGIIHTKTNYIMGYFFPLVIATVIFSIVVIFKKLYTQK